MCTVSWFKSTLGYELFFNRDERIRRADASAPEVYVANGCKILSPTDTEAGGSWIAVNQYGVTVCLLNLYSVIDLDMQKAYLSRGEIIRTLADCTTIEQVELRVSKLDLSQFRTFRVLAIDVHANNVLFSWDGKSFFIEKNTVSPKSSSSVDTVIVRDGRKAIYKQSGLQQSIDRNEFLNFQKNHEPNKKYSVCMHDHNRKTVSLSHIIVNRQNASFDYYPGSPCENPLPVSTQISRLSIDSQPEVA
jgi:hypothetical protein